MIACLVVLLCLAGIVVCAPISTPITLSNENGNSSLKPNWFPSANLTQDWGLKGMTLDQYRQVFIKDYNSVHGDNITEDNAPWWFRNRLIMKNGTSGEAYFISTEDYQKLCSQELDQVVQCDLETNLCILKCDFQIWYPDFEKDIYLHTKQVVVNWDDYIKAQKEKDRKKYEPPTSDFDYNGSDWDESEVQILT